ncbi:MAG: metal-dependent hydrolase [Frankiales bacterium]|jgi:L-ascorbate metabolism protein UlaG (beta-lactamase superfamily)|nr:metal-dependent hydrolase [Frankiales bacterium]
MTDSSVQFIGTATTLLRHGGFTVLTDPNFLHRGQYAYLGHGLASRRLTEPALQVDQLPPIDVVVLSHLHGDHFDRVAKAGLPKDVPILTTRQSARRLRGWGFSEAMALETWESTELSVDGATLTVTATPGRHARGPLQAGLPHVMGSVLEFGGHAPPLSVYITGDTLVHGDLREIPKRFPALDVGLWHLGGTRVLGLLVTMDGKQGADLLEIVTPGMTIPVHYDDYTVFKSPLQDFLDEVRQRRLPGVRVVPRGEVLELPSRP